MTQNVNIIPTRLKRKSAYKARHRLLSIDHDVTSLVQQRLNLPIPNTHQWPWIPNRQCGSWYLPPSSSVYFKSTDGHVGTYAFSLKRLNLHLIEQLHEFGGCYLVDSSVRKILPDSFSRTIPIWCCVMNRMVQRYRRELNIKSSDDWDTKLYTPCSIVSPEEHADMSNLIESRVQLLHNSKAIVDPRRLVNLLGRPLRARWFTNRSWQSDTVSYEGGCSSAKHDEFYTIVCYNPSIYSEHSKNHIRWIDSEVIDSEKRGFYYTPGSADDDATWGRRLTHELFWLNKKRLLDPTLSDDDVDVMIDTLVNSDVDIDGTSSSGTTENNLKCFIDKIGKLNLWIGSRKAGRPPACWESFDAILNVTDIEYPTMSESIKERNQQKCFYLMLPVAEGKKDKSELERYLPLGLCFLIYHLQQGRRVLIHCAQGRDRSVAVVLALISIVCPLEYPLRLRENFEEMELLNLENSELDVNEVSNDKMYKDSGLQSFTANVLLNGSGQDTFLKWAHQYSTSPEPLASKHSLRIGEKRHWHVTLTCHRIYLN